ncbi:4-hydroxy-3-methylbut-2-enyl diphosphate reductase [Cyclonatronum proteinivorum]|uniref:4-hydroxy-3-methylbut-2-enyl diphosphate reductase n=1 Tax=Cyclonatronum proteinivorum TaxID=1457365 RepID=A0A345UFQ2_9BACT|nr:4-hydroxy-3-methylbut-2-enyl diphosphate reductase [Cyclonatronum proteinivorum]AXI99303.1 4-hydroxy-3-methylbut-2-enyl diphosphate reductase [Cyclonatronum proteinivorum]
MAKKFDIPEFYTAEIIKTVKEARQVLDPRKKNLEPVTIDFGPVQFLVPRHFGFCYGVENAIDIAYRTVEQNPDKNIYLLSEMIHNPNVNEDLKRRGVKFLFETNGEVLIPFSDLSADDIVIVPAFGTTLEIQRELEAIGINPYQYDTTCPFVEKVWKRGRQLGKKENALVIHGKHTHEETRATFSHSAAASSAVVVVLNPDEARMLAEIMLEKRPLSDFDTYFGHKSTPGFNPLQDLEKFGVINQTTMLATETQEVMDILRAAVVEKYGEDNVKKHFADTSDTLCYATNENQSATRALMEVDADLALVVGGYNSSNTTHLVELLEHKFPTYHIRDVSEMKSPEEIHHYDQWKKQVLVSQNWLPLQSERPLKIAITSGASCPDSLVDEVILKVLDYFEGTHSLEEALLPFRSEAV